MNTPEPSTDKREIRVFISSTFRDMRMERELLVKEVFPELRRLCDERFVSFTEVDLRLGITEEQRQQFPCPAHPRWVKSAPDECQQVRFWQLVPRDRFGPGCPRRFPRPPHAGGGQISRDGPDGMKTREATFSLPDGAVPAGLLIAFAGQA